MRLIFILFRYFPHGGLQRDCLRIAEALVKRGHGVELVCGEWQGPRPAAIEITELKRHGLTNHGIAARLARDAVALARSRRADAIVGFNRMPGLDLCYVGENCFRAKAEEERSVFYRWLPRFYGFSRLEAGIVGPGTATELMMLSRRQIETYLRHYKIEDRRLHLLPPSIARDRMRPADADSIRGEARTGLDLKPDEFGLLALASAFRTKGLDRSIEAVAALPRPLRDRVKLLVAGRGRPDRYRRLAKRRGIADRVAFLGARDDVAHLLLAADLLLHPARDECAGMAILEAIVAGLPVLCSANCGFSDHVRKADAGLVLPEPFDPAAYAALLTGMLDRGRLDRWSQQGGRYGRSEDLYSGTEAAAALIERVAAAKRDGGPAN